MPYNVSGFRYLLDIYAIGVTGTGSAFDGIRPNWLYLQVLTLYFVRDIIALSSVAARMRSGELFDNSLIANFLECVPEKECLKAIDI